MTRLGLLVENNWEKAKKLARIYELTIPEEYGQFAGNKPENDPKTEKQPITSMS